MDRDYEKEEEEAPKSRINEAQNKLYSPSAPTIEHARKDPDLGYLKDEEKPLSTNWAEPSKIVEKKNKISADKISLLFKKILKIAIGVFVVSLVASILIYLYGNNIISARNISIGVNAPPSAPSSNPFSYDITIQNGNNANLVSSDIIIDYPDGARAVNDDTQPLVSDKIDVGVVNKGQIIKKTAGVRLFGQENDVKTIKITFEYKIAGSAGTFSKSSSFDVALRQAPITVTVDALKEVSNNQAVTLTAKVASNSNNPLQNVVLNVTYPYGFTYVQSNLEVPTGAQGQFPIGDLNPNDSKEIVIQGTISGQSAEDKLFKFDVGTADPSAPSVVSTSLVSYTHDMVLQSDFLSTTVTFGKGDQVSAGDVLQGVVSFKNTLNVPLTDAQISLNINSKLIDTQNITAESGYYDSGKSVITWDKTTDADLASIASGQSGTLNFSIPTLTYTQALAQHINNPTVDLVVNVQAKRLTDANVSEGITSSFTRSIPIVSSIAMTGSSLYASGPIKNLGSTPPKAEHKTTYTAVISLSNSVNDITNGEVTANLPVYMTFENQTSPGSEKVVWNQDQHQLRWDVGDLPAGTGYGSSPRTLYFKVGLVPSKTQLGQAPIMVKDITFSGQDSFTHSNITVNTEPITTATKDPGFVLGDDRVVQ